MSGSDVAERAEIRFHQAVNTSAPAALSCEIRRNYFFTPSDPASGFGGGAVEEGAGIPSIVLGSINSTRVPSGS